MARLRLRQLAQARDDHMPRLSRDRRLTVTMVRRYCYNTSNRREEGPPPIEAFLRALDALANVLGMPPGDLIERSIES